MEILACLLTSFQGTPPGRNPRHRGGTELVPACAEMLGRLLACWEVVGELGAQLFRARLGHLRTDRLPTPVFLGFPGGSPGKESNCNANLYSLKAKKVPGGRLALDDWLGDYWVTTGVGTFANLESGSLLLMMRVSFGNIYRGCQSVPDIPWFWALLL